MKNLEREVPYGEDHDDGDQAGEDQDDDLLEAFVKREQHPFSAGLPESVLPLHLILPPMPMMIGVRYCR